MSSRTLIDVSLYRNSYTRLNDTYQVPFSLDPATIGAVLASGAPLSVSATQVNGRDISARGGEIEIHHELHRTWRLTASYSGAFLSTRIRPEFDPARILDLTSFYPKHMAQLRSSWDLSRRWLADLEIYRTAALVDASQSHQPAFTRADARLEYKLTERASLSLQGRHLLRPWQTEYPGESLYPNRSIGRSITLGLRWVR